MTMKPPHKFKTLNDGEASRLNQNIENAYSTRVESIYKNVSGTSTAYLYQSMESGQNDFSANGSPTIVKSFAFAEPKGTVIMAMAQAKNSQVVANVIDVTSTSITIEARIASSTTTFSANVTAAITVYWFCLASNP